MKDPFRAVNFPIGEDGMRCPNGKNFYLQYRKNVKGNKYGRQEEVYQCEDCSGCPYAEQCKKTDKNRTVRINRELTAMHQEVIENLESIQGALLRMNRSIRQERYLWYHEKRPVVQKNCPKRDKICIA